MRRTCDEARGPCSIAGARARQQRPPSAVDKRMQASTESGQDHDVRRAACVGVRRVRRTLARAKSRRRARRRLRARRARRFVARDERREAESCEARGTEVADHAAGDQRLDDLVRAVERDRDVTSARRGVARTDDLESTRGTGTGRAPIGAEDTTVTALRRAAAALRRRRARARRRPPEARPRSGAVRRSPCSRR